MMEMTSLKIAGPALASPPSATAFIGAIDALITRGVVFCTPDGMTAEQITSLVMRWLGDHPEKRQVPGPRVAASTLQDNFPCPPR
jgi:hypothetical protein